MKKVTYLMVLAAAVLLASCGGGRERNLSPEVLAAGEALSKGLLGEDGQELFLLMSERQTLKEEERAKEIELNRESASVEEYQKLSQEYEKPNADCMEDLDKLLKKLVGKELPAEVAGGVPLKLVKPFTVTDAKIDRENGDYDIIYEGVIELTANRPAIQDTHKYSGSKPFSPQASLVDVDGNTVGGSGIYSFDEIDHYDQDLKAGQQITLKGELGFQYLYDTNHISYRNLKASKIVIAWEHPTDAN